MRARLALRASGAVYEHREVALKDKPAAMLAASPKGTVPVLCLSTGEVLEQSLDIMQWALTQSDPDAWLPAKPELWALTNNTIAINDGAFKANLDRYKYPQRFGLVDGLTHREQGAAWLMTLDAQLRISQSASWSNTVVWNPAQALCAKLVDMPNEGWRHMLCVEAAQVYEPITLPAGGRWEGWQRLQVLNA